MAFHPVQPALPLLMASVLPFLLRQLRIIAGDDARHPVMIFHADSRMASRRLAEPDRETCLE
jgi:hypothetical protein